MRKEIFAKERDFKDMKKAKCLKGKALEEFLESRRDISKKSEPALMRKKLLIRSEI